jgi:hypothetical protein
LNLELAKQLKYNDKILIKYPGTIIAGRFERLSKNGYIHYNTPFTMSGQTAHRSIVDIAFDTRVRFLREGIIEPRNEREKRFVEEFGVKSKDINTSDTPKSGDMK